MQEAQVLAPLREARALAGLRERARLWWYLARQSLSFQLGVLILAAYGAVAIAGVFYTPYDPEQSFVGERFLAPSGSFWFGTDRLGQDVFSRTWTATVLDMRITVEAVGIALAAGVALGTITGYLGGLLDFVFMRVLEVVQAFPALILALMVVAAVGPGEKNVVIVLAFVGLPYYARLVRAEMLTKRTWQYAEAARMVGNSPLRVAFRHLLPNSLGPILAYASVNAAWTVLVAAALGFLGVGVEPGRAEWGAMIARGQPQIITGQWWISFFPGLAVLGLTAGFYLLGDGVRDVLDPRTRR